MGIFRDITGTLKDAAPIIGAGIGMYYGGSYGAALGSGLASSAAGRSTKESLRNAALAGGAAYAIGGQGTLGGGTENFNPANSGLRRLFADTSVPETAVKTAGGGSTGIMGALTKDPLLTASLASATLPLFMGQDESQEEENKMDPYAKGKSRLGVGLVGDKSYNLDDDEERKDYFEAVRERQRVDTVSAKDGGAVKGYNAGGYENSSFEDLYRLVNDREFSEGEQRNIKSALDKRIGGRTGFDALPTSQLKRQLVGSEKAGHTEMDLREIEKVLAKRSAKKTPMPMMAPYMGDPSQLMRNFMVGGEVRGPGSGTSDSVPARLSDGEFVVTADAVRGAGGGDRDVGAARMYDMMSQLEGAA